jgi:hypothetical protein
VINGVVRVLTGEEDQMDMWGNEDMSIEMWAEEMANRFFLSDEVGGLDGTTPDDWIALEPDDWLPMTLSSSAGNS